MTGLELGLIVVAAVGVWWVVDVALRPRKKCRRCHGSGRRRERGHRYDDCGKCDGGKKVQPLRAGARYVRPDLARKGK